MNIPLRILMAACFVASPILSPAASPESKHARTGEIQYINRFLASHGLPPVQMSSGVRTRNGWVYELNRDRFVLARRLGERPSTAAVPAATGRGELVWLRFANGAWRSESPNQRQRPETGIYFQSHSVPAAWADALKLDRARTYYFTVLQCELTPEGSEESAGPVTWEMPAWFENATAVEKAFAAGAR